MSTYQISCTIGTTNPASKLGIEIWVDNTQLYDLSHITQEQSLKFDIDEDESDHTLRFVMKHKTSGDTIIDNSNNIISDACITIDNVAFDDIKLGQVFFDRAVYTHDFNGTGSETKDKFYGQMGCNGTVSIEYSAPVYLWLLENL